MTETNKIQQAYDRLWYASKEDYLNQVIDRNAEKRNQWFFRNSNLKLNQASFFELGCGTGAFYAFLKTKNIKDYQCCDTNDNVIYSLSRLFPELESRVFHVDAAVALSMLPDESVDCIVAFMILEHIQANSLIDIFFTAARVLRAGGEFWINVPCAESVISMYPRYSDLSHQRAFTLANFRTLADLYNFELIAKTGKLIHVNNSKTFLIYLHDQLLYLFNRFLFAFMIGTRSDLGVFSAEMSVILKKKKSKPSG